MQVSSLTNATRYTTPQVVALIANAAQFKKPAVALSNEASELQEAITDLQAALNGVRINSLPALTYVMVNGSIGNSTTTLNELIDHDLIQYSTSTIEAVDGNHAPIAHLVENMVEAASCMTDLLAHYAGKASDASELQGWAKQLESLGQDMEATIAAYADYAKWGEF